MTTNDIDVPRAWHKMQLRVPLFEVDMGQAVYHGNYFHLFELGREAFLRDLGYPYKQLVDEQLHLAVVETNCAYRKSLRYDDLIEIYTSVLWRRTRSLAFSQGIYRREEGGSFELCTKAVLNLVCVHASGRPRTIPKNLANSLDRWMMRENHRD